MRNLKKSTLYLFYFLSLVWIAIWGYADRITLHTGDIFIGEIQSEDKGRFYFNRFDFITFQPTWNVKKIEPDVDTLELTPRNGATATLQLPAKYGNAVSVVSQPPMEASHLEFFPDRTYYYTNGERYLRGYLVNRTQESFFRIHVKVKYYDADNLLLFWQDTEVFDCYPQTMKPFIVDTRFVSWPKVVRISFEYIGGKKMGNQ